jgi:hypothetical protein
MEVGFLKGKVAAGSCVAYLNILPLVGEKDSLFEMESEDVRLVRALKNLETEPPDCLLSSPSSPFSGVILADAITGWTTLLGDMKGW